MNPYPCMEPMSTKASRISNTGGRKWINQSATKGSMNIRSKRASRDRDTKSNRLEWCGPRVVSSHSRRKLWWYLVTTVVCCGDPTVVKYVDVS